MSIRWLTWLIVALIAFVLPGMARADAGSPAHVNAFSGQFQMSVPIGVPSFRGLEPQLSLQHQSGGANGLAGAGWSLSGFSVIERASVGRGAPRYDAADVFVLDGQELVPCGQVSGRGASCGAGGTHAFRVESYSRAFFDGSSWTVTTRDGTRSVYTATHTVSAGTFRWGLASVSDRLGNSVSYGWVCDGSDCYPDSVSYNGTQVQLHREARPDPITFGTGVSLGRTAYRLKSIAVRVGGAVARAYRLQYSTSSPTGRSILASVQQFGRDSTIDGAGNVSGSALPAMTLGTNNAGTGFDVGGTESANAWGETSGNGVGFDVGVWSTGADDLVGDGYDFVRTGDFNGDGYSDVAWTRPTWGKWRMRLGQPGGGFTSVDFSTSGANGLEVDGRNHVVTGDFNGDGLTDIALTRAGWWSWLVYLGQVGGGLSRQTWDLGAANLLDGDGLDYVVTGDFNGDGLSDIAWTRPGWVGFRMALAKVGGGFYFTHWGVSGWGNALGLDGKNFVVVGDFNGDGLDDIATTRPGWAQWHMYVALPGGSFSRTDWTLGAANGIAGDGRDFVRAGDFDGNGTTDLAWTRPTWNGFRMALGKVGGGFYAPTWGTDADGMAVDSKNTVLAGDFNGDGRADVAITRPGWNGWRMRLSNSGGGFSSYVWSTDSDGLAGDGKDVVVTGDYNRDGRTDIAITRPNWNGWRMRTGKVGGATARPGWLVADVNGDGKSDLVHPYAHAADAHSGGVHPHVLVAHSNGDGSYGATEWVAGGWGWVEGNWQVADLNGDGKADLVMPHWRPASCGWSGHVNGPHLHVLTLLSTGNGQFTAGEFANGWGGPQLGRWQVADLNGDGKADLVMPHWRPASCGWSGHVNGPHLHVFTLLSNGDGQFTAGEYANGWGGPQLGSWHVADVDGDGKADLVMPHWRAPASCGCGLAYTHFHALVLRSTGDGGFAGGEYANGWGGPQLGSWQVADVNGDGKADLVMPHWRAAGSCGCGLGYTHFHALVLRGQGNGHFVSSEITNAWAGPQFGKWIVADLNADRRSDLVLPHWRPAGCGWSGHPAGDHLHMLAALATGDDAFGAQEVGWGWGHVPGEWQVADLNGDGRTDLVRAHWRPAACGWSGHAGYDHFHAMAVFGQNGVPDLVTSATSNAGGTTTVSYTPSTTWSNTYLPLGTTFPTVSAVTISDGRGDAQTTTYSYQGARWRDATAADPTREFLGFRKATTTLAATGAYSETYYWQRAGTNAKPEVVYKRRAGGAIMSFDKLAFTENTLPPYTSLSTEAWSHECNGNGVVDANHNYVSGCRRVLVTYAWDQYANMTAEYQYGNYDVGGDERTAVRSFAPNTTDYIVGLPAYDEVHAGIGTGGALLGRTRFFYDSATSETTPPTVGRLTKKGVWLDQTGGYLESSFGYDAWGNTTSVTDPLGRTASKVFDGTYHLYAITASNPLGHTTHKAYDSVLGLVTSSTDPDGNVSTLAYDVFGRVTLTVGPTGAQTRLEYLSWGSPTTQKTRQSFLLPGGTWVWEDTYFDGVGRLYKKAGQNGVAAETIFGATGKTWKQSLPYAADANGTPLETVRWDVTTYDDLGRELTVTRANGATMTRVYGNDWATVTDAVGAVRTTWVDAAGRVVAVREVVGGQNADTTFSYDLLGRRTKSVDALGNQTVVSYDSIGRALQKSDPDQGLWRYGYDAVGRITSETDALNATTTVAYDVLGRATRRTYSNGAYDSYTFDETGRGSSKGRLTTTSSTSGVTTRAWYDASGRRTRYESVVDGVTYAISHTYDVAGRLATVTYPDNEVVTYGYGTSGYALGRLVSVGNKVTGVSYTAKGQMASITYGNGVTTAYGFDGYGEHTTSIQVGALATISYGYDNGGRITSMASPQLGLTNWSFGYDALGRLTGATNTANSTYTQSFGFDVAGRMTAQTGVGSYAYGAATHPHAVTTAGTNTYAYDANGNLTAGAGRTLSYDLDHRPVAITAAGATTTFTYDAQGQRVKKVGPAGTVVYVGGLYEVRGAAVTKYYLAGGARVAKVNGAGTSYFHQDHLGSTRLVTNASGAEVKRYEYAPFGKVIAESGSAGDSHRFTGQEVDDETGLAFFQARYYDAALGRFLQPDGFLPNANNPQELDVYAYANNSPINYVDPSGHAPALVAVGVMSASTAATVTAVGLTVGTLVNCAAVFIGVAMTFSRNPLLQSVGMVLSGMGAAALGGPLAGLGGSLRATTFVGGAVALAQSPVSPLDSTVKKAIGWGYTVWGGVSAIDRLAHGVQVANDFIGPREPWKPLLMPPGMAQWAGGSIARAAGAMAAYEVMTTAGAWALAYGVSYGGTALRGAFAFVGRAFVTMSAATPGPLTMLGATYDLAYTMRYPDGRVVDLSGGQGGETFEFYYHTGYEMGTSFGRQHIRVGDGGGYWEIGDSRTGYFGPGLGWGGWVSTQKVTVIMSPAQAASFRGALAKGAQVTGGYQGFHADSHTYISAALQFATGKSAADLHINPGLIHW
jgi:RHS repeat-associated protein